MLALALLGAALAFTEADATNAYRAAEDLVKTCTPRDAGTVRGRLAALRILDAASAHGARVWLEEFDAPTPRGRRLFTNVLAEWQTSATGEWVVVVSHYDTKPGTACPGANDGASTTGLLVALAGILNNAHADNVALMWLDGEECMRGYTENDGLWGSKHAAKRLKASGRAVRAVICVDMLGDRDLTISIPRNVSPDLRTVALKAARRLRLGGKVRAIRELVKDDHLPFMCEGFPAIDLIDFDYGDAPKKNNWWHTPADTMDKLDVSSFLVAGRLVVAMLNDLLGAAP